MLEADRIVDRRRLKRRLTVWRLIAIAALVAAVVAVVGKASDLSHKNHVARLEVEGFIFEDRWRDKALRDLAKDDSVKALVVSIDSPGGSVVGGETLYNSLRAVSGKKPVVAVVRGLGASAAYMAALGCERVFARAGSLTGSIGVIMQTADMTELLGKIGVKPETIKSGPLKAQPNPLETMTPEAREVAKQVVLDFHHLFMEMVGERRRMTAEQVLPLADGRVFTGRQALENGLVDALGGETEARTWLKETHGVSEDLPIRDVDIERDQPWERVLSGAIGKALFSERVRLDGLVSVWHPGGW